MIRYEWLLAFALVLVLAIADLVRTRRDARRARDRETGSDDSRERRGD
jgi:hypothetical protein